MPHKTPATILHICKVYLPVKGGVQKVVHAITTLSNQYAHHVLTSGEDGAIASQEIGGTTVSRCRSYLEVASMPIAPAMIIKSIRLAKTSQIVCLHYPFPLADLAMSMVIKLPPLVVYWHSNIVVQKKLRWLTYPFISLTLHRAAAIVVTSERMIDNSALLKRFRKKVKIIPYGLSAVKEVPPYDQAEKDYFVLVGRHVSYKGIDVAIRAMKKVISHLVIAGDGPLFEQHKLLTETLGVCDRVTFKKNVSDEGIVSLIQGSTAIVVPSVMHNEAFALVQLEAMRLKKPVINTYLASTVPAVARDGKEGLTVKPNCVPSLEGAMQEILSNPALAKKLGNNGYHRFFNNYTEKKFKVALDSLFEELLTE